MNVNRRGLRAAVVLVLCALVPLDVVEPRPVDLVTQGRQALDAERVDEAIGLLERAASADARNPAVLASLGSAQVRKAGGVPAIEAAGWVKRGFDTLDEARAAWTKGRKLYPSAPEARAIERELRSL